MKVNQIKKEKKTLQNTALQKNEQQTSSLTRRALSLY